MCIILQLCSAYRNYPELHHWHSSKLSMPLHSVMSKKERILSSFFLRSHTVEIPALNFEALQLFNLPSISTFFSIVSTILFRLAPAVAILNSAFCSFPALLAFCYLPAPIPFCSLPALLALRSLPATSSGSLARAHTISLADDPSLRMTGVDWCPDKLSSTAVLP